MCKHEFCMNFVIKILINLFSSRENLFVGLNSWIAGSNLIKHYCQIKKVINDVFKVTPYYLQIMKLILLILPSPGLASQACFKKTETRLELLTDIGMLVMVVKRNQGRNVP